MRMRAASRGEISRLATRSNISEFVMVSIVRAAGTVA
jgi:hypothetical protein